MAWESRSGSGRYYTRSRRVNGKIVREYIGHGPIAEATYNADLLARQHRETERNAFDAARMADAERDGQLDSFNDLSKTVTDALLLLAGFHFHKRGEWRKRNERND
jgi:hypothetical protein